MKPPIDKQFRERFFAQYWGQNCEVVKSSFYPVPRGIVIKIDTTVLKYYLSNDKMKLSALLRPLSALTDPEYLLIAKIINGNDGWQTVEDGKREIAEWEWTWPSPQSVGWVHDYLRSIGVATPYLGYSVEELVTAGLAKLAE